MYLFFDSVIRPLLDATRPTTVIEIGSDEGLGTEIVAGWCRDNDATLHVIDPSPKYSVDEWSALWAGVAEFHIDLSLNVLAGLPAADLALVDGDHNWHTVFNELASLARRARENGRRFPLTLLHDVGWPYGRRDLYYDPDNIPAEHRQPHEKGGLIPGQSELAAEGFNDSVHNATEEGSARNGVLTAVEDFLATHGDGLEMHLIPGLHGLAIIVDTESPAVVHEAITEVIGAPGLRRVLTMVEQQRVQLISEAYLAKREAARVARRAKELEGVRRDFDQLKRDYDRLVNRRSVQASLRAASLLRPLFRRWRSMRASR